MPNAGRKQDSVFVVSEAGTVVPDDQDLHDLPPWLLEGGITFLTIYGSAPKFVKNPARAAAALAIGNARRQVHDHLVAPGTAADSSLKA